MMMAHAKRERGLRHQRQLDQSHLLSVHGGVARSHFHWSVIGKQAHCTHAQIERNAETMRR